VIFAQPGIFALGDASHGYFEFSLHDGADARALVEAVANLRQPHMTVGGANIVVGYASEVWRSVASARERDRRGARAACAARARIDGVVVQA
jgi:hypothetical protein